MRTLYAENILDSFITVDDKNKKIVKMSCKCEQFRWDCIHKVGKVANIKYYATPCIHLAKLFNGLIMAGFDLKVPMIEDGPKKLTSKIRKAIYAAWGRECFFPDCHETEDLCIHRLVRKGPYSILNGRPYCGEHHRKLHSMEKGCH